jgi:hypothetical protein
LNTPSITHFGHAGIALSKNHYVRSNLAVAFFGIKTATSPIYKPFRSNIYNMGNETGVKEIQRA